MSITNKLTAGLVSIAVVFSISLVPTASAQSSTGYQQTPSYRAVSVSGSVCPYTWTRNLSTGSTGEDVRQLQRFLNGNPNTTVATSGAGSPGNETVYYGPATARAVSKFQEQFAAQILTPLGLTKGTGGFYSSTRNQANEQCRTSGGISRAPSKPIQAPPVIDVTGNVLAVTPGNQVGDSYAVIGAQRVPYTSFVLTAGNKDVRLEGVRVKKFGLSGSDGFETVALANARGEQIGSARSLNSRDEARLGGNFVIPRNSSVTLTIIGNVIGSDDDDADSISGIAGIEVIGVDANARVQGSFPIRGATHLFSDAITLQNVEVSVTDGDSEIQFNEDTEIGTFTFDVDASNDSDEEDVYLRSVTFEQRGSADESEVGDITFYVDDDRADYSLSVADDRYTIFFDGRGILIEEGDSIDISIEVNTNTGYEEDIQFAVDSNSDVYAVGASYGFGLPVVFEGEADDIEVAASTIQSGGISGGGKLRSTEFEDEVRYGRDVVIGAHSVEFEGEDIDMEGLEFSVVFDDYGNKITTSEDSKWDDADEDSITLDNIRLVVDGEVVAYGDLVDSSGDQADFEEPNACDNSTPGNECDPITLYVEFDDSFTIDVRDNREVIFEVVANLDRSWSHFDGVTLSLELTDVGTAEGVNSEKDYTDSGEYFATAQEFESVEIIGNELDFEITSAGVDESDFVAGTEDVVFGTFEVDASNAIDDILAKNLRVTFAPVGGEDETEVADLSNLRDCAVYDESDDRVAEGRDSLTGKSVWDGSSAFDDSATDQIRFRFEGSAVIDSDSEAEFEIRCDIDDDAAAGGGYTISVDTDEDTFEYEIAGDRFDEALSGSSQAISVATSGKLVITVNHPDDDRALFSQATGSGGVDNVDVVEIELEAEEEDIRITDMYLQDLEIVDSAGLTEAELDKVIDSMVIGLGNTTARPRHFEGALDIYGDSTQEGRVLKFENVNEVIEVGSSGSQTFDLSIDYSGITENKGLAGVWIDAGNLVVKWEGVTSDEEGTTVQSLANNFTTVRVFPTVPVVSAETRDQTIINASSRKLYEFSIRADDEGDVYLKQVGLALTLSGANTALSNVRVLRGTQSSSKRVGAITGTVSASATKKVEFATVEKIDAGETVTYSVYATVAGLDEDGSVSVGLAADSTAITARTDAVGKPYGASVGNFVWSPDTMNGRGSTASTNKDWFNGYAVFVDGDIGSWASSR